MKRSTKWILLVTAAVLLIAAVVLLVPFSTHVTYEGVAVEYSLTDPTVAVEHQVTIDGQYWYRILGQDRFQGTFYLSGIDGMTQRENNAHFSLEPGSLYAPAFLDAYGQPFSTEVSALLFDRNFQHLAAQLIDSSGRGDLRFIAFGAADRADAVSQYEALLKSLK